MNRCAVVIGVNKTGDLPVLNAAASGAEDFAAWAMEQGIQVTLLTDAKGSVTLSEIKKAIRLYVQQRTFDQLIVFFSGHGILRAPDYELWLLSGAPDDPDDAVNVPGSIWLARNAGIPHVILISDACRSRPNTTRLSQIQGGVIFPNEAPKTPRPTIDVFYATLPGDTALEVPSTDAVQNYRGIFTECILKGLRGTVSNIIVDVGDKKLKETRWVVPSWGLKSYLEQEVPNTASEVNIKLQQEPDIRVESHPPKFLAEIKDLQLPSLPRGRRSTTTFRNLRTGRILTLPQAGDDTKEPKKTLYKDVIESYQQAAFTSKSATVRGGKRGSAVSAAVDRLLQARGRKNFETRTGFTIIGTGIERAIATKSSCDIFEESGAFQVRVHTATDNQPQSLLAELTGGNGIPLAILPGFIGTVLVEEGRVTSIAYVPSQQTVKYKQYERVSEAVERRRAFIAVATQNGSFRIEGGPQAVNGARYLRELKGVDPIFGLYAAYAYAQAGDFEGVESVYTYMSKEHEPVLFDVALLAGKLFTENAHPSSPFCPMLTQGWALLTPIEKQLLTIVKAVRRNLVPGLWTTFTPEAVKKLWSAIEKGKLL